MGYVARNLHCRDCSRFFPFSAEQQGLGAELGFDHPKRCPNCQRSLEGARRSFRQAGTRLERPGGAVLRRKAMNVTVARVRS
jgi:hypothetical protein